MRVNTNPPGKYNDAGLETVDREYNENRGRQHTCDLQLRALNMSKRTKQVKVIVVSLGVTLLSLNWKYTQTRALQVIMTTWLQSTSVVHSKRYVPLDDLNLDNVANKNK